MSKTLDHTKLAYILVDTLGKLQDVERELEHLRQHSTELEEENLKLSQTFHELRAFLYRHEADLSGVKSPKDAKVLADRVAQALDDMLIKSGMVKL